jgi:hypothetical protein
MRFPRLMLTGRSLAFVTVLALLIFPASSAFAASDSTLTQHGTYTFENVAPCGAQAGSAYNVTANFTNVTHFSTDPNGGEHLTFTETARFVAQPVSGIGTTYSGHYTFRDGGNTTQQTFNGTTTFIVIGTGEDGSTIRFTEVAHISVSATGVTVQFDRPVCH